MSTEMNAIIIPALALPFDTVILEMFFENCGRPFLEYCRPVRYHNQLQNIRIKSENSTSKAFLFLLVKNGYQAGVQNLNGAF